MSSVGPGGLEPGRELSGCMLRLLQQHHGPLAKPGAIAEVGRGGMCDGHRCCSLHGRELPWRSAVHAARKTAQAMIGAIVGERGIQAIHLIIAEVYRQQNFPQRSTHMPRPLSWTWVDNEED